MSILEDVLALVPGAKTERGLIDFEKLSLALGDHIEPERERFAMTWPGKAAAAKIAHTSSHGTLRPMRSESVSFDDAEHVIIEGDNLEVLKLLQRSYNARVKVIYIDPPYNTGHDFVYEDDFRDPLASYLAATGQVGENGERLASNPETDGRYHSRWLSMMLPRLALARNLLRQDGVIFISIDDIEVANLRKLCDEVFGEENFLAQLVHQRAKGGGQAKQVVRGHDYVLVYARDADFVQPLRRDKVIQGRTVTQGDVEYLVDDDVVRKTFGKYDRSDGDRRCDYEDLVKYKGAAKKAQVDAKLASGEWFLEELPTGNHRICRLIPLSEASSKLYSIIKALSEEGREDLDALGLGEAFQYSKSTDLVVQLIRSVGVDVDNDTIVLDFFAGSGTTAEAVLRLNVADQGRRRVILVQLPEPTGRKDYPTIADITRERVRRVIAREQLHAGFRAFRLDSSNVRPWDADRAASPEGLAEQLELHVEPILPDRTDEDILFEILQRSGIALAESIEVRSVEGETVHVAGDVMVCLSRRLTLQLIRTIAALKPARVVVLDAGFRGDDALKANAVETMRSQGVLSFKSL
ncbi:MAG: site-specific DNA-methyltransferase [Myxococcales bacterium]|nr:site-specific DNA-methyltransferase [Myxococcales bacterium]